MQNRLSQILKGIKAIQTYDLPIITELLSVSCEEILSCGKSFVPAANHVTNYEIAFSKDKDLWEKYVNREDKLFLNPDEYNKTVLDYAIEFKNYEFLKFLMENKYIWFVDDSKFDNHDRAFGFGAGTSIKRRELGFNDTLDTMLRYHSEERGLRQEVIALAMENRDFSILTELRAREVPALYQLCEYCNPQTNLSDYYNENVIAGIAASNADVLRYFSEDFTITDIRGNEYWFIYPYLGDVIKELVNKKSPFAEVLLKRAIEHNKKVFKALSEMMNDAVKISTERYSNWYGNPADIIREEALRYYWFNDQDHFLSYFYSRGKNDCPRLCANMVYVDADSSDLILGTLLSELKASYDAIIEITPNLGSAKEV